MNFERLHWAHLGWGDETDILNLEEGRGELLGKR